ncbi:MAG TPA: protein kinase, partial [Bdellovibrionota bacterium]|nr:protein kinase [Bdellovibrionota bacterium]
MPNQQSFITFGQYLLLDRLAAGGMAEIYLARPLSMRGDGRIVVVKRVLPQVADDPNFLNMFRTETRVCVGFNHPNIVQMYDFGQVDRQPYIAMEYVEGRNLQDLMSRFHKQGKTIPLNVATTIVGRAADALHYAHTYRNRVTGEKVCIVHRDVSPQNILVSYDGKVKLIDFGIAKAGGERGEQTRMGTIKGKIAYLSPEQVRCEPLDGRSDVFSLGIVLWELLAGKRLFNPAGSNDFQVIQTIANCDKHIKPPSHYNPEVPNDLDEIVMKALKAVKEERYSSAEQFQTDLRKFIVEGLPGSSFEQTAETMQQTFAQEMMHGRDYVVQLDRAAQTFLESAHDMPEGTMALPTSVIHARQLMIGTPPAPTPPSPVRQEVSGKTSMTRLMAAKVAVPGDPGAQALPVAPAPPQPYMAPPPIPAPMQQSMQQQVQQQVQQQMHQQMQQQMQQQMAHQTAHHAYPAQPNTQAYPGYTSTRVRAMAPAFASAGSAPGSGGMYMMPSAPAAQTQTNPGVQVKQPLFTRMRVLGTILYVSTIWFIKADQEYLFFERFFIPTHIVREAAMAPPGRRSIQRVSHPVGPSQPAVEQAPAAQQSSSEPAAPATGSDEPVSARPPDEADPGQARLSASATQPARGRSSGQIPRRSVQLRINIQPPASNVP